MVIKIHVYQILGLVNYETTPSLSLIYLNIQRHLKFCPMVEKLSCLAINLIFHSLWFRVLIKMELYSQSRKFP